MESRREASIDLFYLTYLRHGTDYVEASGDHVAQHPEDRVRHLVQRERSRFALASSRQSRTSGTFGAAPPRPRPTPHVLSGGGGGGGIDPSNRTSADNPLIGGLGAYTR